MTLLYKIMERVFELENKGCKIVKMNVGELDFDTPEEIATAGKKAIIEGKTSYGSAAGEMELREEIARIHEVEIENVAIAPGSKWAIFTMINLLCRNKKVLGFSPGWPAFESMARHFDARFQTVELKMEESWQVDFAEFKEAVKGNSLVIINNPCNPTSQGWDDEIQEELTEVAQKENVPVLLDLAYRDIFFEKKPDITWGEGTIICNSFSKSLGMTGWRIGYIVAEKELIRKYVQLNQISITCVPKFIQLAALEGLRNREEITERFRKECRKRADAAMKVFDEYGVQCVPPKAGFYVFPKLACKDAFDVCMKLLEDEKIAIVPGSVFGNYPQNVRISLCYSPEIITDSLTKLMDVLKR